MPAERYFAATKTVTVQTQYKRQAILVPRFQNDTAYIFHLSYITTNTRKLVSLSHISLPQEWEYYVRYCKKNIVVAKQHLHSKVKSLLTPSPNKML